ncbi:MAG TPA: hypothetical protein VNN10_12045 [Dehalococcoidia bacterium]|nr:hypothetical protein [Dehalococcoidia bacterium]
MISSAFGKITNEHGEVVAEGTCEVDDERGSVTLRPILDMPLLERQRGPMRLTLDDGAELLLTDRVIHFRVNLPGQRPGSVYRLFIARQQGLNRWAPPPAGDREGGQRPASGGQPEQPLRGSEHDPSRDPDELPPEFRKDPQR